MFKIYSDTHKKDKAKGKKQNLCQQKSSCPSSHGHVGHEKLKFPPK